MKGKLTSRIFAIVISLFFFGLATPTAYSQEYDRDTVVKAQRRLQELGYNPGPLDGIWGEKTKGALKRFQHDRGLSMTAKLDLVTQKTLGLISLEKRTPKHRTLSLFPELRIMEALQHAWKIKKVQIENDILTIVPHSKHVGIKEYTSMILRICKELHEYHDTLNQLREIRILNRSENQGWILLETGQCDQIMDASSNEVNNLIFSKSADVLIFKSR